MKIIEREKASEAREERRKHWRVTKYIAIVRWLSEPPRVVERPGEPDKEREGEQERQEDSQERKGEEEAARKRHTDRERRVSVTHPGPTTTWEWVTHWARSLSNSLRQQIQCPRFVKPRKALTINPLETGLIAPGLHLQLCLTEEERENVTLSCLAHLPLSSPLLSSSLRFSRLAGCFHWGHKINCVHFSSLGHK